MLPQRFMIHAKNMSWQPGRTLLIDLLYASIQHGWRIFTNSLVKIHIIIYLIAFCSDVVNQLSSWLSAIWPNEVTNKFNLSRTLLVYLLFTSVSAFVRCQQCQCQQCQCRCFCFVWNPSNTSSFSQIILFMNLLLGRTMDLVKGRTLVLFLQIFQLRYFVVYRTLSVIVRGWRGILYLFTRGRCHDKSIFSDISRG